MPLMLAEKIAIYVSKKLKVMMKQRNSLII